MKNIGDITGDHVEKSIPKIMRFVILRMLRSKQKTLMDKYILRHANDDEFGQEEKHQNNITF